MAATPEVISAPTSTRINGHKDSAALSRDAITPQTLHVANGHALGAGRDELVLVLQLPTLKKKVEVPSEPKTDQFSISIHDGQQSLESGLYNQMIDSRTELLRQKARLLTEGIAFALPTGPGREFQMPLVAAGSVIYPNMMDAISSNRVLEGEVKRLRLQMEEEGANGAMIRSVLGINGQEAKGIESVDSEFSGLGETALRILGVNVQKFMNADKDSRDKLINAAYVQSTRDIEPGGRSRLNLAMDYASTVFGTAIKNRIS